MLLDRLSALPGITALEHAAGAPQALEALDAAHFDVLLVDAAVSRRSVAAWERLTERLGRAPRVIFYLTSPPEDDQISSILDAAGAAGRAPSPAVAEAAGGDEEAWAALRRRIPVFFRGQIRLVPTGAVHVATFHDRRVVVRTAEGAFPCPLSMGELQGRVRGHAFLQVHRRYVVNLDHVQSIETQLGGGYVLRVGSGTSEFPVPVSRRRAVELRRELGL